MRDFSPEEKLLRLIKGKRKSPFGPEELVMPKEEIEPEKKIKPETEEKKDISKKDEKAAPAEARKESKEAEKPLDKKAPPERIRVKLPAGVRTGLPKGPNFSSLLIYAGITAVAIFLLVSVIGLFTSGLNKEKQELQGLKALIASISKTAEEEAIRPGEAPPARKEEPVPEKAKPESGPSFDEYQKLLLQKDIFAAPVKEREKTALPEGPTLRELVQGLSLVGVIPGDEPQAIIEDKKNQQTLFLKKGDQIDGIEIREIQSGRVILGYGQETVTLSL